MKTSIQEMNMRKFVLGLVAAVLSTGAFAVEVRQVMKEARYSRGDENVRVVQPADTAAWIWMPGADVYGVAAYGDEAKARSLKGEAPAWFFRFRNDFTADGSPLRFDVTADERFVLYLDGKAIARGPQRGMPNHWCFQSYEIKGLEPGSHRLEAVCWQLGANAPVAQLSYRGGFLLKAEGAYDAKLTTGRGGWRVAPLVNTAMAPRNRELLGVGNPCRVTGTGFPCEEPPADAWRPAAIVRAGIDGERWWERQPGWMLFPADRPDQLYAVKTPGRVVNAGQDLTKPFTVPARTELDLWWDLGDYYCAYPELETSGGAGATVTWGWTESLREAKGAKGNRDEWKGKSFTQTLTDTFVSDGRPDAFFTTPWWRCGRWCRLTVRTADAPLGIRRVALGETRVLAGSPDDFAALARRRGEVWQVGAITDWTARELDLDTSFLGDGKWTLESFADASDADTAPERYVRGQRTVSAKENLHLKLAPGGGWTGRFTRTFR